jgi:hypothetical protein
MLTELVVIACQCDRRRTRVTGAPPIKWRRKDIDNRHTGSVSTGPTIYCLSSIRFQICPDNLPTPCPFPNLNLLLLIRHVQINTTSSPAKGATSSAVTKQERRKVDV